jgi:hypothetical protein
MSILHHHHFSNDILCGFQWYNLFVVGRVLTCEILEGISFVKLDGEKQLDAITKSDQSFFLRRILMEKFDIYIYYDKDCLINVSIRKIQPLYILAS